MARSDNQKPKLLYLAKIFEEETDEHHGLTNAELQEALAKYGIAAERKTVASDIAVLKEFGMEISAYKKGRAPAFYLDASGRPFELAELKILVDSVQSARFITQKKSDQLIKKLEKLTSKNDAARLKRQVLTAGRIKAENKSILYNVDEIYDAIALDKQIQFSYFKWNIKKEQELQPKLTAEGKKTKWHTASPWYLHRNNEFYYLIAYDAADGIIKHYRIDRMKELHKLDAPREGREMMEHFDAAAYTNRLFSMFGGEEVRVTLECENRIIPAMIDRFGKDIPVIPTDECHFRTVVSVAESAQFFGWVASLAGSVRITAPESAVEKMRELSEKLSAQYGYTS